MAKYRSIHVKIWDDPDFETYSVEKKLVFIYLSTNPATSESGIYAVTPKKISDNTGIEQNLVTKIMKDIKNVMWNEKLNYVYIRRFRVYNGHGGAPENIKTAIVNEFLQSSTLSFWNNFIEDYPEFKEAILSTGKPLMPTLPLNNPLSTNSNTISNSNSIEPLDNGSPTIKKQQLKKQYGQFHNVLLTDNELAKLKEKFNSSFQEKIERLSEYIESKGKRYSSHYATILTWDRRDSTGGKYHGTNAAYKNQPAGTSETPHAIDGDAEASEG